MIEKILFITLSNFGDVILTLPVLDALRAEYPDAQITAMVGPRAAEIFKNNPYLARLIIYDKYAPLRKKMRLFFELAREGFDLVIDLRNTLYGALLPAKYRSSPFLYMPSHIRHMKQRNLHILTKALRHKGRFRKTEQKFFYIDRECEDYINELLEASGITGKQKIILLSPATGGKTRRWDEQKFIQLGLALAQSNSVILIGRKEDKPLTQHILGSCREALAAKRAPGLASEPKGGIYDFAGATNLAQLAALFKRASALVVCDTGVLHLASYLDVPVVGLFGPSDEQRYGPWSSRFKVVTSSVSCRPCRRPDCRFNTNQCMHKISLSQVLDSIDEMIK